MPDAGKALDCRQNEHNQGFGQIVSCFNLLTNDNLQPHIPQRDFLTNNVIAAFENTDYLSYNLFVFDLPFERKFSSAQPKILNFKFYEHVADGVVGYHPRETIE